MQFLQYRPLIEPYTHFLKKGNIKSQKKFKEWSIAVIYLNERFGLNSISTKNAKTKKSDRITPYVVGCPTLSKGCFK
jgi:hypothetical protein